MKSPEIRHFASSRGLAEHLLENLHPSLVKVVSFDVFDTLLFRKLHPDLILDSVGRKLLSLLRAQGTDVAMEPRLARSRAYADIAGQKVRAGLDPDMTLEELVPAWVKTTAGKEDVGETIISQVLEFEQECERLSVYPNEILIDAAKILRTRGFEVVFTSDMYLGSEHISRLLEHVGGHVFTAAYVSGDHSLLKRTGRLYHKLLESEKVLPHQVVHVGDNYLADGLQAVRQGIHSCVLRCPEEKKRTAAMRREFRRFLADRNWGGSVASAFVFQDFESSKVTDEEIYGLRMFGPIFSTFIHRLAERCRQEKVTRVYFAAREGFLLKRLFETISPHVWPDGNGPKPVYLGVSRLTTFLASAKSYGPREVLLCRMNTPVTSVRAMLAPYRIDPEVLASRSALHGVDDVDAPLSVDAEDTGGLLEITPLGAIVSDSIIQDIVNEKHRDARAQLESYLCTTGFFSAGRVAFVDVGWSAQIQDNIFQAYKERSDFPSILGFYLGCRSTAKQKETSRSRIEGLLTDQHFPDWHGNAAFLFVQAVEAVTRAPHGTVMGYRWEEDVNRYVPIFKTDTDPSRRQEQKDAQLIARIQSGIFDYASGYFKAISILSLPSENYLPYARSLLDRVFRFPNKQEAKWLLGLSNVSDLGSSDVYTMGADVSGGRIRKFLSLAGRSLKRSFWPNGTVVQIGLPLLPSALVVLQGVRLGPLNGAAGPPVALDDGYTASTSEPLFSCGPVLDWEFRLDADLDGAWRKSLGGGDGARIRSRSDFKAPALGFFDVLRSDVLGRFVNLLRIIQGLPSFSLSGLPLRIYILAFFRFRLR